MSGSKCGHCITDTEQRTKCPAQPNQNRNHTGHQNHGNTNARPFGYEIHTRYLTFKLVHAGNIDVDEIAKSTDRCFDGLVYVGLRSAWELPQPEDIPDLILRVLQSAPLIFSRHILLHYLKLPQQVGFE